MGGADAVLARAREDFAKGEYRWVASAMSQVVFADPSTARPASSAPTRWSRWATRPSRLPGATPTCMGATELRSGVPKIPAGGSANADTSKA